MTSEFGSWYEKSLSNYVSKCYWFLIFLNSSGALSQLEKQCMKSCYWHLLALLNTVATKRNQYLPKNPTWRKQNVSLQIDIATWWQKEGSVKILIVISPLVSSCHNSITLFFIYISEISQRHRKTSDVGRNLVKPHFT